MVKILVRAFALAACVIGLGAFTATAARADGGAAGEPQLLDVSHQVAGIQKKLSELLARGQQARPGALVAGAACGYGPASTVFAYWGDPAAYALAPEGDLSSTDGWTLSKQARVASEADPFTGSAQSLQLPKDAEAGTPAMCVNLDNPTIRFFTRDVGGNGKSNLKVDILYEDFDGHVKHLTIARLKAGTEWQPTAILPIYMNVLALASPTGVTAVALEFKAEGLQKDEVLSISSIYVDPFSSR
jgi:hypothetical protein